MEKVMTVFGSLKAFFQQAFEGLHRPLLIFLASSDSHETPMAEW
jgi:hypothetical protein